MSDSTLSSSVRLPPGKSTMNHSALDSDSDSDKCDYVYEEELVVMEFPVSSTGREQQEPRQEHLSVIAMESSTPIVQLGAVTYRGQWDELVGTNVVFANRHGNDDDDDDDDNGGMDVIDHGQQSAKRFDTFATSRILRFDEVTMKQRDGDAEASAMVESELTE